MHNPNLQIYSWYSDYLQLRLFDGVVDFCHQNPAFFFGFFQNRFINNTGDKKGKILTIADIAQGVENFKDGHTFKSLYILF